MMPRRILAALAVALFATIAVPAAAHADPYVSGSTVTADRYTVAAGETVTVTWHDSYFTPGAAVAVTVDGCAADTATLTVAGAVTQGATTSTTADGNGSVMAQVTFGASAAGSCSITGAAASATGGVTVNVVSAAASASGARAISSGPVLAATGGSLPLGLGVAGGGMLVLGAVLISARLLNRRRIESATFGD